MKNPIQPGDKAWAACEHGKIIAVHGDHVHFEATNVRVDPRALVEWRHWTSCLYDADVILRLLSDPKRKPVGKRTASAVRTQSRRRAK
jgi:hypothetical protein